MQNKLQEMTDKLYNEGLSKENRKARKSSHAHARRLTKLLHKPESKLRR